MEKFDTGVPVIRGEHLNEGGSISTVWSDYWFVTDAYSASYPKTVLEENDIVMSVRGTVGTFNRVGKAHIGAQISPNLIRIVPDPKKIYPPFLYYALRSADVVAQIKGSVASSAVPALKASDIKSAKLRLPAINKQVEATETLIALDDRITLLRETNTTLEAIAQALFKSWFVDFDPVHAKMQGRAPEGMDEATAALFPDSFEEAELGAVPKGWSVGNLNELAELNPESWTAKRHPDRVLYVDLANTKAGQIDKYNEFSFEDSPSRARRVLRCGDVIVGTVRPGNRSFARIATDIAGLTGSTGFAVLRSREVVDQALVYIAATNDEAIDRLSHLADGGAYPAVRPEVVGTTPLVIATEEIRNSFGDITNPLFASIGANQERMTQLASLRDTLLPRLISGQLILNDYQATLAA
jgi:type I restriction enzyme S subunit